MAEADRCVTKEEKHDFVGTSAEKALEIYRELKDQDGIADATRLIIACLRYKDKRKEAAQIGKDQLAIFREKNDNTGVAKMLMSLAEVNYKHRGSKHRADALQQALEARDIFHRLGEQRGEAHALIALGNVYLKYADRNDQDTQNMAYEASKAFAEAQGLYSKLGDKKGEATALHGRGTARVLTHAYDSGLSYATQARDLFAELGIKKSEAFETHSIGIWHLEAGNLDEALAEAQTAAKMFRTMADKVDKTLPPNFEMAALSTCLSVYVKQGEFGQATKMAKDAMKRFQKKKQKHGEASAMEMLVFISVEKEEFDEALEKAQEVIQIRQEMDDSHALASMLLTVCQIHYNRGEIDLALEAVQSAVSVYEEAGGTGQKTLAQPMLVKCLMARQELDKAYEAAKTERKMWNESGGGDRREACAMLRMSEVHCQKGEFGAALKLCLEGQVMLRNSGDKLEEGLVLKQISEIYIATQENERALHASERAAEIFKQVGERVEQAGMLLTVAQAHTALLHASKGSARFAARHAKAMKAAKECSLIAKRFDNKQLLAQAQGAVAQIYMIGAEVSKKPQDLLSAAQWAESSVNTLRAAGDEVGEAHALVLSAKTLMAMSELDKALEAADEALSLFQDNKVSKGVAMASELVAKIEEKVGRDRDDSEDDDYSEDEEEETTIAVSGGGISLQDVTAFVKSSVTQMVGAGAELEDDSPLMMVSGLNSMSSAMLQEVLQSEFSISLPVTLAFDYPSVNGIAQFIHSQQAGSKTTTKVVKSKKPKKSKKKSSGKKRIGGGGGGEASRGTAIAAAPRVSRGAVVNKVTEAVASFVGQGAELEVDTPLMMVSGLNSMSSAMLQDVLQQEFGCTLPVTLAFDYPSINAIADYVLTVA
eukprot:gnl/TRDRNA2_/TRDRNA2_181387_c0_seq1.p1 gnl/TRDRNA2_/TRDRNA2_181387_c0~~gnl/TRDRNA2_/TRDRNA2_181387_c0_seq1.p1  ORF type:complete len:936 (+),score=264.23 gnl/TRDRNA2_/TRDRNA2_181387_c0_seq1:168-2810(+)